MYQALKFFTHLQGRAWFKVTFVPLMPQLISRSLSKQAAYLPSARSLMQNTS